MIRRRRRTTRRAARLALPALLLALATGCDEKTGEFFLPADLGQPLTGAIEGRVTDEDGNGLSGVTITRATDGASQSTQTGQDGTYAFPVVPPGNHTITVTPPANRTCTPPSRSVTLLAGGTATADFVCAQVPGSITGTVTSGGSGLQGATVTLTGEGVNRSTTTAGDGSFGFDQVPPGTYTITTTASNQTCGDQSVTVSAGEATAVTVGCQPAPGSITGTVRVDGSPTSESVQVTLLQGGSQVAQATTSSGTYSFPNLAPGSYAVRITPPSGVECPTVEKTGTVQSGQGTTIDFDCATQGSGNQTPSRSQLDGDYQVGLTTTSQQGGCPSPINGTFTGSVNVNGTVDVTGFDPQVPAQGSYDESTGDLMATGTITLSNSFSIEAVLVLVATFDPVSRVLLQGVLQRIHRDPSNNVACIENIQVDALQASQASSGRFKTGVIHPLGTRSVLGLRPVVFRYRAPWGDPAVTHAGFLAEEVASAYPTAAGLDGEGRPDRIHPRRLGEAVVGEAATRAGEAARGAVARVAEALRAGVLGR